MVSYLNLILEKNYQSRSQPPALNSNLNGTSLENHPRCSFMIFAREDTISIQQAKIFLKINTLKIKKICVSDERKMKISTNTNCSLIAVSWYIYGWCFHNKRFMNKHGQPWTWDEPKDTLVYVLDLTLWWLMTDDGFFLYCPSEWKCVCLWSSIPRVSSVKCLISTEIELYHLIWRFSKNMHRREKKMQYALIDILIWAYHKIFTLILQY